MISWLETKLEIAHGDNKPMLSMEGLRGIAVFLVFWVHYSALIKPWVSGNSLDILNFVSHLGHLGVDLFFVLSGYLIYGSIISKREFFAYKYARRRIQRIYPVFLVVFAVYLVLSVVFPSESKIPQHPVQASKYLLQNLLLLPGLFDIKPIITVAWSLSYEAFYYLVMPLVIFVLKLKRWPAVNRIKLWMVVALIGFSAHYLLGGPVRLLMFVCGMLLFELFENKKIRLKRGGGLYLLSALFLFGLGSSIAVNYTVLMIAVFILFLLFCLCAFNPESTAYSWLTIAPLRWFGNMSYSYYLIHGLSLKFAFLVLSYFVSDAVSSSSIYYWLWLPLFLFTLIVSFLLYLTVERPFSLDLGKTSNRSKLAGDKSLKRI